MIAYCIIAHEHPNGTVSLFTRVDRANVRPQEEEHAAAISDLLEPVLKAHFEGLIAEAKRGNFVTGGEGITPIIQERLRRAEEAE